MGSYRQLIEAEAARIWWDPDLLDAQVSVESSYDTFAFRYEPAFFQRYVKNSPHYRLFGPLAACSYGLLQIMLVDAIEVGFVGEPWELFDPATGLYWGCKKLQQLAKQTAGQQQALAAYNGGLHNPQIAYADKVFAERDRIVAARTSARPPTSV